MRFGDLIPPLRGWHSYATQNPNAHALGYVDGAAPRLAHCARNRLQMTVMPSGQSRLAARRKDLARFLREALWTARSFAAALVGDHLEHVCGMPDPYSLRSPTKAAAQPPQSKALRAATADHLPDRVEREFGSHRVRHAGSVLVAVSHESGGTAAAVQSASRYNSRPSCGIALNANSDRLACNMPDPCSSRSPTKAAAQPPQSKALRAATAGHLVGSR
jgi:hypothetical protein